MPMYSISTQDTYIHLIRENIFLIKKLIKNSKSKSVSLSRNPSEFYKLRAKHLQIMLLIGTTSEHLLKAISLSRDFSIFEIDYVKNKSQVKFSKKTISFNKASKLFLKSNPVHYFNNIKTYEFNTGDTDYEYSYLGYKKIDPKKCIKLIQNIRNNYVHSADSHGEMNGITWYVFNFIIWLAKKEFKPYFSRIKYIGNDDIKRLFKS